MKKIISLLVLIVLSFSLASCLGENKIESISVAGFNNQYFVNEVIDTSNVLVTVKYTVDKSANYTVDVTDTRLEIELPDMSTVGTKSIKVTFKEEGQEFSAEKSIEVIERKNTLVNLVVDQNLPQEVYYVGDTIDLSNVTLKAYYDVEGLTEQRVDVLSYDDFKEGIGEINDTIGKHALSITYGGKTVILNYEIKANYIVKIELVNADSINDVYYVGDAVDTSAITAKVTYANGDVVNLENKDLQISSADTSTIGEKEITVTYEGKTVVIDYVVDSTTNKIASLEILGLENVYYVGDEINQDNISVKVNYKPELELPGRVLDAAEYEILFDYSVSNAIKINVVYDGFAKEFNISLVAVELVDIVITTSLPESCRVGTDIDTSVITALAIYNNGDEVELTASNLVIGSLNTNTPGDKSVDVSYTALGKTIHKAIVVSVLEPEYNYTILEVYKPIFIQDYEKNIAEKDDKTSEFYDRDNSYIVGNQNPFKFLPEISALDANGKTVIVTEYHSYSKVYLIEGDSKTLLEGDSLDQYVSINEYTSEYQFTPYAAGSEFELTVQPHDDRETENNKVSFRFNVVDGYNVYNSQDLLVMNDDPYYANDWNAYYSENDIVVPKLGTPTIVIHGTIIIKPSDFPSTFFHQESTYKDVNNIDWHTERVAGTLKDQLDLYSRKLKQDEVFTIHGNYFTINADDMPLVSEHKWDGSNTQLFFFNSYDGVTNSKVNINNLYLWGNTNKSSFEKDYGGLIGIKIHGNHGAIDCEINNVIVKSFLISQLTAYERAKSVFNYCKLYDSYSNLSCAWEQTSVTYNNCYIAESGGPLIVGSYEYDSNFPDSYINIEYNNIEYSSLLSGEESWFKASDSVDKVNQIKGVNEYAFKLQGGIAGLFNKDKYMTCLIAVVNGDPHPSKPYAMLKATINGKTIINTVDDQQTIGTITALTNINKDIPIFFNSNGEVAFWNGSQLCYTNQQPVAKGSTFYTTGEYMAMYASGHIYILKYNTTSIV